MDWRGLAWPPSRNPLRNRRRTTLRWRMRPVPVVFLLLALMDQLSARNIKQNIRPSTYNWSERLTDLESKHRQKYQKKTKTKTKTYMNAIWPLDIHTVNMLIFGYDTRIYRNDDTTCASYYAVFQNLMYPSSEIFKRICFSMQGSIHFEVMWRLTNLTRTVWWFLPAHTNFGKIPHFTRFQINDFLIISWVIAETIMHIHEVYTSPS